MSGKNKKETNIDLQGFKNKFLPRFEGTEKEWLERPTGKVLTNLFEHMSLYGLGHPSVDGILDPPSIKLTIASRTPTLSCQRYQEIPPIESYHTLENPFLPLEWSTELNNDSYEYDSFIASEDHASWRRKIMEKETTFFLGESLFKTQTEAYSGVRPTRKDYCADKMHNIMVEYPFAPSSLYSSSCIKKLRICDNQYLLVADNQGHVKVANVSSTPEKGLTLNNFSSIRHPKFGKHSRVYGLATGSNNSLVALKYWDGVTIAKLSQQEDAFSGNFVFNQSCNQCHINDVALSDILDSVITVSSDGSITMSDLQTNKTIGLWNSVYSDQIENFFWATLSASSPSPYLVKVGSRKSINIFDVRKGSRVCELFRFNSLECLGAMTASQHSAFQFYCSTNFSTYLFDERFFAEPLTFTSHPSNRENRDIPSGCNTFFETDSGLEYVSVCWSDGEVMLFVNDWSHAVCSKRAAHLAPVNLSCQKKETEKTYPVSRGIPVGLPSINYLHNNCSNMSQRTSNRLLLPWVGLETLKVLEDKLTFFGVNAIGDVFVTDIKATKAGKNLYNSRDSSMPSKSNSVGGSTYLPSDLFSPTWLLDGLDGHKSYEMRTKAKEKIEDWQKRILEIDSWSKINLITDLFLRRKLEAKDSTKKVKGKKRKKIKKVLPETEIKQKGTKGKPRKTVRSIIRNLPGTKFTSASKYSSFGKRIADIFNGVQVIDDVLFSDEESSIYLHSERSLERQSQSGRSSTDREVSSKTSDEPFVTKEEFDQGLVEKAQVSTQADDRPSFDLSTIHRVPTSEKTRAWLDNQTETQDLGESLKPATPIMKSSEEKRTAFLSQSQANSSQGRNKKRKYQTGF